MKVRQSEHNWQDERRFVVYLTEDDGTFVDSFDYNTVDNTIRFYGSEKEYDFNKIPKLKQRLWRSNNLVKDYLFMEKTI